MARKSATGVMRYREAVTQRTIRHFRPASYDDLIAIFGVYLLLR